MKKLEELGASPAPWEIDDPWTGDIICHLKNGIEYQVAVPYIHSDEETEANAHLITAAPKLYKALYELVEAYEACNAHDGTCENCERRKMCQQDEERIIANAKSALAEASGEGGEDK